MKKLLAWSLVLTFALAAPLSAEQVKPEKKKPTPEERFAKLDKNSDKMLSLEEFKGKRDEAKAKKAFDAKDKDKNGSLSLEEFKAAPGGKKPKPKTDK
jgi:Ca2+-binding EF-hand superfamily protein